MNDIPLAVRLRLLAEQVKDKGHLANFDGNISATLSEAADVVARVAAPVQERQLLEQAIHNALAAELGSVYDCTRVWSAWSVGTMSEDDFVPTSERMGEFVAAVLAAIDAHLSKPAIAPKRCTDCGDSGLAVGGLETCPTCCGGTAEDFQPSAPLTDAEIDQAYFASGVDPENGAEGFDAGVRYATEALQAAAQPVGNWTLGDWYEAQSVDDMQCFFRARLPAIREAAREHGYAIGVHGSERRDFDLIAAPWRDDAADADTLSRAIAVAACGITREGAYSFEQKPLGRLAVSIPICWTSRPGVLSDGHIDLSVMPAATPPAGERSTPAEPTHQHIKSGGKYVYVGHGKLQTDIPLEDLEVLIAYRGEDGRLWFRAPAEFNERFKRIATPPSAQAKGGEHG